MINSRTARNVLLGLMGFLLMDAGLVFGQAKPENPRMKREVNYRRDASPAKPTPPEPIVIEKVGRAAMGYPRVFTRVFYKREMIPGEPANGLVQQARTQEGDWLDLNIAEGFGPQSWWTSVLDTGAGGYSINQDTARRFRIQAAWDAIFFVHGVDGTVTKGVSPTLTVNIAGSNGRLFETPSTPFIFVQDFAQFGISLEAFNPNYYVIPNGMNLVGMQAIRRFTIEVDSTSMDLNTIANPLDLTEDEGLHDRLKNVITGPTVRVFPTSHRPTNNIVVMPMQYVSYLQMGGTETRGALDQSSTPVLQGVKTAHRDRSFTGDFLFDTGSPYTIISRRMAYQLGLIKSANPAFDDPEFRDVVSGIAGRTLNLPGFNIDSLAIRNPQGEIVEWKNVPVLVHDVWIRSLDGRRTVRDGIMGNNLFIPSTSGEFGDDGKMEVLPAAFPRFWVHGPTAQLWIERPIKELTEDSE